MNRLILLSLLIVCLTNNCIKARAEQTGQTQPTVFLYASLENIIPREAEILISVYPSHIVNYEDNHIVFANGSRLLFDDGKRKTVSELIEHPDIKNMFAYSYEKGKINAPQRFHNPGRIRNDAFFRNMYGRTLAEAQRNLTTIVWCPKLVGQRLQITRINGVDRQLAAVSAELDEHPEWKEYLRSAGTFNWRVISGTGRLSPHSFGIAIDLNLQYSNYWQWDYQTTSEYAELTYRNRIPQGIVDVFEKHGFIWGGKWYHYDTMHFEYRPELLFTETYISLNSER